MFLRSCFQVDLYNVTPENPRQGVDPFELTYVRATIDYAYTMENDNGDPRCNHFATLVGKKKDVDEGDVFEEDRMSAWLNSLRAESHEPNSKDLEDEIRLKEKLTKELSSKFREDYNRLSVPSIPCTFTAADVDKYLQSIDRVITYNQLVTYLKNFHANVTLYVPLDLRDTKKLGLLKRFYRGVHEYYTNNPQGLYIDAGTRQLRKNRKRRYSDGRAGFRDEVQTALLATDFTSHHPVRIPGDRVGPPLSVCSAYSALSVAMGLDDPLVSTLSMVAVL